MLITHDFKYLGSLHINWMMNFLYIIIFARFFQVMKKDKVCLNTFLFASHVYKYIDRNVFLIIISHIYLK